MPKKNAAKPIEWGKREQAIILTTAGIALFLMFGWLWWQKVYNNPERVFWDMIQTSLQTPSVTKHITQTGQGSSLDQVLQLQTGWPTQTRTLTTANQSDGTNNDVVKTETLGIAQADFVRYLAIVSNRKDSQGKPVDFKSAVNVWGKSVGDGQNPPQFLNNGVLGVVPFAALNRHQREVVILDAKDKKVYDTDFKSAKRAKENGRQVLVYKVNVTPSGYVDMLHVFASILNLPGANQLDPSQYQDAQALPFEFAVDVASHQLARITYPNNTRVEHYSGYGFEGQKTPQPTNTIPAAELTKRLQPSQ